MSKYLDRQITRLWIWLLAAGARSRATANCRIEPGDAERLIEALMCMNDVLARAARS